jgi:hypothetical protein
MTIAPVQPPPFWVIFDTCMRPEYYQDVHNILALPANYIYRYEYRRTELSGAALAAAQANPYPTQALLVYAQSKSYKRGGTEPTGTLPDSEMLWVGTRLAEVGFLYDAEDVYYFDLKLAGYPADNPKALSDILAPLIAAKLVPFEKWVATSNQEQSLQQLRAGTFHSNWIKVTEKLSAPPAQFADDVFWRLVGPTPRVREGKLPNTETVSAATSYYRAFDGERQWFTVFSHSLQGTSTPQAEVQLATAQNGPLILESHSPVSIRPHSSFAFAIRIGRSDILDEWESTLSAETPTSRTMWPMGPKLTLTYVVGKRLWKVLVGSMSVIAGSILALAQFLALVGSGSVLALLLTVLGGLLVTLGTLLLQGKLTVKF